MPDVTRGDLLRTIGAVSGATAAASVLAACTSEVVTRSPAASSAPLISGAPTTPSTPTTSVLLAYYSRPGENYSYGGRRNLRTGNTEVLAHMLADRIDCDVFRIEADEPYPDSYDDKS